MIILAARAPLAIVAMVAGLTATASAGDWPRWRGPELTGISREKIQSSHWPKEGPRQLWKASVGTGFSSMSVAEGRLFTMGNKEDVDTVFCLDAATGREIWKHSYPCPADPIYYEGGPGSTPTVDGDRVFTLSKRGHLFCFEAASGKVVWQRNLSEELGVAPPRWGFSGSPMVEGELLLLNLGSAGTALEKGTGKVVWTSGKEASGYATVIPLSFAGERQALVFAAKALVGVRIRDGRELWRLPWVTKWDINAADPIVLGDRVFLSTFDRGSAMLRLASGAPEPVWATKKMANHFNSCVQVGGFLYGVHGNTDQAEKDLRCLDAQTGELKWQFSGLGLGSLMVADGRLIVLSEKGELVVAPASPDGFNPEVRVQVTGGKCWTVPVLAGGRLYCRNAAGTVVCLDAASR